MAMTAPLLDLDTLTDRPRIRINGKFFEMRTRNEFSFLTYRQHRSRFQRLGALLTAKRVSLKEEKEQARLLDEFCRLILVAPDAVHGRLRDTHRVEIVSAFFSQPQKGASPARAVTAAKPARRS